MSMDMEHKDSSNDIQKEPGDIEDIRVLLVEDDKTNQSVIAWCFELAGAQVVLAENGYEAVSELIKNKFDVVLMDLQMPKMDGITTASIIREMEAGTENHIPIIALTAYADSRDIQKCLEAGMDDFLSKPVDLNVLLEKIKKWVKRI